MSESKSTLKRPKNPMPPFVRDALNERGLMDAYLARPPYQQNDYLGWIARAKLEATKTKRLNQMLDELKGGRLYMNMTWKPRLQRDSNAE
ncbi:MAG: YdeI/OmpD-associated family protein [Methanothrix sp.]|nr:YdeI/OmpD-associated family protein [Methanothrix sp.]